MFGLTDHNVSVTNLNLRVEKHGDERKPACDIRIVADISSERLNEISPGLCESLFRKPGPGDQLPLVEVGKKPEPGFTALKHPGLEPSRIKQKFPGYELQLVPPTGDAEDALFLADVEVKNFTIEPHEGGSTAVTFTASSLVDEDEIAALLAFLRDEDAVATLTPPKSQAQHAAEAPETCESGDPNCGPVEHHDADGVPLCKACYEALDTTSTDPDDGEEARPAEDIPAAA